MDARKPQKRGKASVRRGSAGHPGPERPRLGSKPAGGRTASDSQPPSRRRPGLWRRLLRTSLSPHTEAGYLSRLLGGLLLALLVLGILATAEYIVLRGALLHDIGKMGVPDEILRKPGPLNAGEWEAMRKHPNYARELLGPIEHLRGALEIPYAHHERWDGSGYPRGLRDEQIPLAARVFAVVDVWDALQSDRPYRPAWSAEKAEDHLRENAGKLFDPRVVDTFLQMVKEPGAAI